MSRLKPLRFREIVKRLRKYDKRFEVLTEKGKGSHRMISHPDILGKSVSYPVICHGEGDEIYVRIIADIIRRFDLPKDVLG